MKNKLFFLLPCIAAVAITAFVGTKTLKSNADESNELLMANVEALTSGEENNYRYPENKGQARFCTLYVYIKGGVVISTSSEPNTQYETSGEYTRITKEGLKDKCPLKGKGCNPYSCQEVPY